MTLLPVDHPVYYPAIPKIVVADCIRPTLGPVKKRIWTAARNAAFDEWAASGLVFDVIPGIEPVPWPYCFSGTITITERELDPWGPIPAVCPFYGDKGCAALQVDYATMGFFDKYNRSYMRALLAHEIGHALGLSHVGMGIMRWGYDANASNHVTPLEIATVKDYFDV